MLLLYYYSFFSSYRLTGVVVPLAGQTDGRTKKTLNLQIGFRKRNIKSSHGYIGEKKPYFISVYPACLCSSDTAQADQNQCSKCWLCDCRGESPCLLPLVFISIFLQSASEANISKTE